MIELRQRLYESLLDDEDDLMSRGDNATIQDMADKLFKGGYKYEINSKGLISYDGVLIAASKNTLEIIGRIFSGEYFTEYERFSDLEITGKLCDTIFKHIKTPITIHKIDYFYLTSSAFVNINPGDIKIDEIKTFDLILVKENLIKWHEIFKNTRIKEMYINVGNYIDGISSKEELVNLSDLNIDKLIINDEVFQDKTRMFKDAEIILANNNIKHLYIHDLFEKSRTKFNGRSMKVKKIK